MNKLDAIAEAWRALNRTEPPDRIKLDNLSGSRHGEKRGVGGRFVVSHKAPFPRKR